MNIERMWIPASKWALLAILTLPSATNAAMDARAQSAFDQAYDLMKQSRIYDAAPL